MHYADINIAQNMNNIKGWGGSCWGISAVASSAFVQQILSTQLGSNNVYELKEPINNTLLRDVINILQCSSTTLPRIGNKSFFTSQQDFRKKLVDFLNNTQDNTTLPILDFKINMGEHMGNHAVVPYSVSENNDEYIIWIYDPNHLVPQKMTIGKDYNSITYRGDSNVKINDIVTNPDVININTYAPGLISDSSAASLADAEQYDFTTLLLDTSSEVTITNDKKQMLTVKGDEIISGDINVLSIEHIADMDESFALIILENDTSGKQNLKIQSNANGEVTAAINNNYNIGYIHTSGSSHTAEYSSDGKVSVLSDGKIEGGILYSNPVLVQNTDVFSVELSGEDTSNMSITTNDGAVRVDSDNLSNIKISATHKDEEYYTTDFSLSNTEHSSTNAEITESNSNAVLNIDTDNDGIYDETYSPIWNITPPEDIAAGDEISAVANIDIQNCELILALYDKDNRLITTAIKSYTNNAERKEVRLSIPENINLDGCYTKAFIWNNMNDMQPLSECRKIELNKI